MKTAQFDIELEISPDVIRDNIANTALLNYVTEHHPTIEKIKVLDIDPVDEHRKIYKMKYIVVMPMPKALKKILQSESNEMTSGMTLVLEVNNESASAKATIIPEMMSDKTMSTCLTTFSQRGDKWIMHVEIKVEVKAFGIGGTMEKHIAEVSRDLMEKQYQLTNEFLRGK